MPSPDRHPAPPAPPPPAATTAPTPAAASRGSKVLLAMSGGVDSSVAAALLTQAGHEVVGVFMRLGSPGDPLDELIDADRDPAACGLTGRGSAPPTPASPDPPGALRLGHRGCCSVGDAADARHVAARLGIPFYVVNFKKDFGRIIDYFVDEYARGRTPNPCVRCNDWLKFGRLHDYAEQIGASSVASGHYARVEPGPDGSPRLLRGVDHGKDQSYVLFGAPRDRLGRMLLPVGGYRKAQIRELAREFGLPVFDKPDSQEICFVPDDDYAGLVERRRPALARRGEVVDRSGAVLAEHAGQHRFTIGQRRGLGLASGIPLYVLDKDPMTNRVVVGPAEGLMATSALCAEANWLVDPPDPARGPVAVLARWRSNGELAPARLLPAPLDGHDGHDGREASQIPTPSGRVGGFRVEFDRPVRAVAPGQALVLHDPAEPDVVLGGGWVARVERPTFDLDT